MSKLLKAIQRPFVAVAGSGTTLNRIERQARKTALVRIRKPNSDVVLRAPSTWLRRCLRDLCG